MKKTLATLLTLAALVLGTLSAISVGANENPNAEAAQAVQVNDLHDQSECIGYPAVTCRY